MSDATDKIDDMDGSKRVQVYLYYAEQTEKFIERRAANSRYFLSINSALVAIVGVALKYASSGQTLWLVALPAAGLLICALWWRIVRSYSVLTGAKFAVIRALEARLPTAPYTDEWDLIAQNPKHRGYKSISALEARVPWVFAIIYAFLIAAVLLTASTTTTPIAP